MKFQVSCQKCSEFFWIHAYLSPKKLPEVREKFPVEDSYTVNFNMKGYGMIIG